MGRVHSYKKLSKQQLKRIIEDGYGAQRSYTLGQASRAATELEDREIRFQMWHAQGNPKVPFVQTTGGNILQMMEVDFLRGAASWAGISDSAWESDFALRGRMVSAAQFADLTEAVAHKGMVPQRVGDSIYFSQQARWKGPARRNSTGYVAAKIRANTARRNAGITD